MQLQNKVALITGAAVRVGREIALGLAREGVRIGLHYSRSQQAANELLTHMTDLGTEAVLLQGDFTNIDEIKSVVHSCHQRFGGIDILVNNAAVYFKTPFGDTRPEEWDHLMAVNLRGVYFCSQFVAKIMERQKSGKIVNISDVAGLHPWPDFIPYSCSKAGVIALTRGMAKALAPYIQVNAIASGTVMMQPDAEPDLEKKVRDQSLLKRIGSPEDIVNTVRYLLEGSDFVTGEVIAVDGGRHLL